MELTRLALRRPVSTVIVIAAIVIFGFMSIFQMNMQLSPDMEMPMFLVYTQYLGVAPEDIDELVTQPVEETGAKLKGIKNIESISYENLSMVMFQYDYGTDMDDAYMDLLEALNAKQNELPKDCGKPYIIELNMNQIPSVVISASTDGDADVLNYVNDKVVPELEKLADVAEVKVSGGEEAYISVTLDQQKMNQYGVTMSDVVTYINAADFTMPVGTAYYGRSSMNVSISAEYNTINQLLAIPVTTKKGGVIQLSDVADISQKYKDSGSLSRYNGLNNVTINISKRQRAGDVAVAKAVRNTISKLAKESEGVNFEIISDQSEGVKSSLKSVAETLILGMALSMLILFLFFGDLKGSFIVGCSMPVSVLLTIILMNFMEFSLNVVTMGGMVIGVGMMVDNSIVVLESCFRMRDRDLDFRESALEGTKYVMNSIIASTATTVVVFLPIALTKGLTGQIFKPLGFTIVFSLLASLFSAITLVPLFFSKYKPVEKKTSPVTKLVNAISNVYSEFLKRVLHHKAIAFIIAIALLVGSGFAATNLHTELIPASDSGHIQISINGRPGLKIEEYDRFITEIESMVAAEANVEKYSLSASAQDASGSVDAYLLKDRTRETSEIAEEWRLSLVNTTGFDVSVSEISDTGIGGMSASDMSNDDITITLSGSKRDDLKDASNQVEQMMKTVPGIISTTSTANGSGSKAKIVIDPIKAAAVGFTPAIVASNVNMALSGVETIDIINNRKEYKVTVEYPKGTYEKVTDLNQLTMISPVGKTVVLGDISEIVYTDSPQQIERSNSRYSVTISATPTKSAKYTAEDEIEANVKQMVFPGDCAESTSISDEMMTEELTTLGMAILVSFLLVLMLMAMQFESIKFSMMVMWCVPFSLVGSIGLMLLTQVTVSMVAMMGILMLIGTVVNNGILYVDTTNQMRETMSREKALVEAGRIRLRPILMTSLTTILAMVPMSVGLGEGTEMMQSMGIVIIGGYVASTFLTLLLLPVFYVLMDNIGSKKRNKKGVESDIAHKEDVTEDIIIEASANKDLTDKKESTEKPEKKKEKKSKNRKKDAGTDITIIDLDSEEIDNDK